MPGDPNKLSQFWQELKRRKVVRVITVYAAAAFVILELTDIVAPSLGLPDWTLNFIIILLCVGFIISVILSWIYDIHPEEGIVKTEPAPKGKTENSTDSSRGWKMASYISFVVIIALLAFNLFTGKGRITIDESLEKSIAVLPFLNLIGDPEQEYICVGLTDEIISNLYKIKSFDKVVSLTSVLSYKHSEKKTNEIAEDLCVNYVLEGTYKKIGDQLRVTAQLIEPNNDKHIWLHDYDRPYEEIIAIPTDIALQIADHLKAFISDEEKQRVERISTSNEEAFEIFQEMKYHFFSRNTPSIPYVEILQKAIELDPEYADVYAWLGFAALWELSYTGMSNSQLTVYDALSNINKALELDADNALAHTILGIYNLWVKWDYPEAENQFLIAADLEPNNTDIIFYLNPFYLSMDRIEEFAPYSLNSVQVMEFALLLYAKLKNHQEFEKARKKYYDFVGTSALPPIGESYIWLEEYDSALYCFEKAIELENWEMQTSRFQAHLAIAYYKTNNSNEARDIITELISRSDQSLLGSPEYFIGMYYGGIGEIDSSFIWLEKAFNRHSAELYWLKVNPILESIRDDPRYWDLYERTGHKAYDDYLASRINK